jgi:hypothetical protein
VNLPVIIRGTFSHQAFVPEGPLPEVEGRAELIVYTQTPENPAPQRSSICDVFGKAKQLRSAEDIDAQLEEERASWDDAGSTQIPASRVECI